MCPVTCVSRNIKIDETKWEEHLTSSIHLQKYKNVDDDIAIKIFEMIFETRPEKKKIFNLKNEKPCIFLRLYFSKKLAKEKFDTFCNDSTDKLEIEKIFRWILTILYQESHLLSEKFLWFDER